MKKSFIILLIIMIPYFLFGDEVKVQEAEILHIQTLDEVLKAVKEGNSQLLEMQDQATVTKKNIVLKALPLNPELKIELDNFSIDDGIRNSNLSFMFTQKIETGLTFLHRKKGADLEYHRISHQYELVYRETQLQALFSWLSILIQQKKLESATLILNQSDKLRSLIRSKVDAGLLIALDAYQADLDYKRRQIQISSLESELNDLKAQLALLMGYSITDVVFEPGDSLNVLSKMAFKVNFQHKGVDPFYQTETSLNLAVAKLDKKLQIAKAIPDVEAGLGFTWVGSETRYLLSAELTIPLPIFRQNIDGIRESELKIRLAKNRAKQNEVKLNNRYAQLIRAYELALERWNSFQSEMLPVAKMSLELEQGWYFNGKSQISRLLKAQSDMEEAKISSYDALKELIYCAISLSTLMGEAPYLLNNQEVFSDSKK